MNNLLRPFTGAAYLSIALALTACGGGGGGGSSTPASKPASSTALSSIAPSSIAPSSTSSSSSKLSSSSAASLAKCTVDGKQWNICTGESTNWGFENGQYCIAQQFCPANRTSLPIAAMRAVPVDANATAKTQAIYTYLKSIWGQKTLSGQQDLTWKDSIDMAGRVFTDTGKYPAIMGYDFMNYGMTASWAEGVKQT